jgi:hypothetical protein
MYGNRFGYRNSTIISAQIMQQARRAFCSTWHVFPFIISFETSPELSLAIPGWARTSIAEAFLSRPGRNTHFPWMRRLEHP